MSQARILVHCGQEICQQLRQNLWEKYWEIIADNLSNAGCNWGCVSAIDSNGRTIWIAEAHRGDGKRYVVRADELLTAFVELESAIAESSEFHATNALSSDTAQAHKRRTKVS